MGRPGSGAAAATLLLAMVAAPAQPAEPAPLIGGASEGATVVKTVPWPGLGHERTIWDDFAAFSTAAVVKVDPYWLAAEPDPPLFPWAEGRPVVWPVPPVPEVDWRRAQPCAPGGFREHTAHCRAWARGMV
jgi:hypothetical protein